MFHHFTATYIEIDDDECVVENEESHSNSQWCDLPDLLLEEIFSHLTIRERYENKLSLLKEVKILENLFMCEFFQKYFTLISIGSKKEESKYSPTKKDSIPLTKLIHNH